MTTLLTSDEVRAAVSDCGGLVSAADLGRRWKVSRSRIQELTHMDDFPQPVDWPSGRPVWLWGEVNNWRQARNGG